MQAVALKAGVLKTGALEEGQSYAAELAELNERLGRAGFVEHVRRYAFGKRLWIDAFRFQNGLRVLLVEDHTAPVVAYHTWFRVGSRHEKVGKTGLAHLFEHLMFNETESLPKGAFDRKLEEAGAESNASTWLDFTQYNISAPSSELDLVISMEADRMQNLVLREPQVESEKEVVANERRYRVDDDVEGSINELLWVTALDQHAYRWPTIGWMQDIQGFTTEDCREFYRTFYVPNNASVVVVGDFSRIELLEKLARAYGVLDAAELPTEDVRPEPPQLQERRVEVQKITPTEKLVIGYHGPALGDFDYSATVLLCEVLLGGRASRLHQRMVRELELANEARLSVGPFRDPGLIELYASAREGVTAEQLLTIIDEEIERVKQAPVAASEIERARSRFELATLHSLESAEGKAQTVGFYDCVLGEPDAAFGRLEALSRVTPSDLLRVARRYLNETSRTIVLVRSQEESDADATDEDETQEDA